MKWQPLHDQIIAERVESDPRTKGGIFIPDQAKEKPQRALVIAVGPGRTLENGTVLPMSVKPGDEVLFSRYSGSEIEQDDNGSPLLFLREGDLLAVVRE